MANMTFDKNDPQKWLQEIRKLFQMWMNKAEIGGGTIKFDHKYIFEIPKTKEEKKYTTIPIQKSIGYSANDINNIYMMISEAVRNYIKS